MFGQTIPSLVVLLAMPLLAQTTLELRGRYFTEEGSDCSTQPYKTKTFFEEEDPSSQDFSFPPYEVVCGNIRVALTELTFVGLPPTVSTNDITGQDIRGQIIQLSAPLQIGLSAKLTVTIPPDPVDPKSNKRSVVISFEEANNLTRSTCPDIDLTYDEENGQNFDNGPVVFAPPLGTCVLNSLVYYSQGGSGAAGAGFNFHVTVRRGWREWPVELHLAGTPFYRRDASIDDQFTEDTLASCQAPESASSVPFERRVFKASGLARKVRNFALKSSGGAWTASAPAGTSSKYRYRVLCPDGSDCRLQVTSIAVAYKTGADWLTFSPTSGPVTKDNPFQTTVTADATKLNPGTYTAVVTVTLDSGQKATRAVTFTVDPPCSALLKPSVLFPTQSDKLWDLELKGLPSPKITAVQFGTLPQAVVVSSGANKIVLKQRVPANTKPGRYEAMITDDGKVVPAGVFLYVAGLEMFDPYPALIERTGPDSVVVVTDPAKIGDAILAKTALSRKAVSADGVTQVLLRIPSDRKMSIRLDSGGLGNSGFLRSLSGQETVVLNGITPLADPDPKIGSAVYVIYRAPADIFNKPNADQFDAKVQDDLGNPAPNDPGTQSIVISLETEESVSNQEAPRTHREFTLVRPPLVLIHGIWATSGWRAFDLAKTVQSITGTRHVVAPDWSHYSAAGFDPRHKPFGAGESVAAGIRRAVEHYRKSRQIAATQVDAVAVSGGGVIARVLSQAYELYKRADNYLKGDIHKLITLGSPHTGALFLVYVWNNKDRTIYRWPTTTHTIEGVKVTELRSQKITVADMMADTGRPIDKGMVQDLLPCSEALRAVEESPIPTHAIAGVRPDGFAGWLTFRIILNATTGSESWFHSVDQVFGETPDKPDKFHDLVVETQSAHGGLDYDASAKHDPFQYPAHDQMDIIHSWIPTAGEWWTGVWAGYEAQVEEHAKWEKYSLEENPTLQKLVGQLLRIPSDDSNVYRPLPAPRLVRSVYDTKATGPCTPVRTADAHHSRPSSRSPIAVARAEAATPDSYIEIVSPKIGETFAPGDTVTIIAEVRNRLEPKEVYFSGTQGTPLQHTQNELKATWTVPTEFVGANLISVYALGADGILYSSLTEVFVEPNQPFVSLAALPESLEFQYPTESQTVSLMGWYADGKRVWLTGSRNVNYVSSDPTVATVNSTGLVAAVGNGSATITASFGDVRAEIPVTVAITNQRPVFQAISPFQVSAGDSLTVPINVESPANNELSIAAYLLPGFAQLAGTGPATTLVLNPRSGDEGSYQVRFVAQDRGNPPLSAVMTASFTVVAGSVSGSPAMTIAPLALDFGAVEAGRSKDMALTVRNTGTAILNVKSVARSNGAFNWISPAPPFIVDAGSQVTASVRFTAPTTPGVQSGVLTITSDDQKAPSSQVALTATVNLPATPAMTVTPAALDFGAIALGQDQSLNLSVANHGTAALQVASITSDNPQFVPSVRAFNVTAGSAVPLPVRFTPASAGPQSGTLTIASNDPLTPQASIPVRGSGVSATSVDVVLKVDGGNFASAVGAEGAATIFFVNRLTPPSYPATLKNVQIYFGNRGDGLMRNAPITIFVAANPNGSPFFSALTLENGSLSPAVVSSVGTFNSYAVSPLTITKGDFVVGFMTPNPAGIYPADQDDITPSARRSYVSFNGYTFELADDLDVAGNFGIRATVTLGSAATAPTPGTVLVSDSFNRGDASACALGRADLAKGGSGSHYYLPIFTTSSVGIAAGALQNLGLDYSGVQFSASAGCGGRGETLPQNLYIAVDLLVPVSSAGVVQAGPFFRSRAAAPGDGIIGGTSAGYWIALSSTGEVAIRGLNPNSIVATSVPAAGFDATRFHTLQAVVRGSSLTVLLDGNRLTFNPNGIATATVGLPVSSGSNDGTAGIAFGAEANRGRAGGQRARNLVIGTPGGVME